MDCPDGHSLFSGQLSTIMACCWSPSCFLHSSFCGSTVPSLLQDPKCTGTFSAQLPSALTSLHSHNTQRQSGHVNQELLISDYKHEFQLLTEKSDLWETKETEAHYYPPTPIKAAPSTWEGQLNHHLKFKAPFTFHCSLQKKSKLFFSPENFNWGISQIFLFLVCLLFVLIKNFPSQQSGKLMAR